MISPTEAPDDLVGRVQDLQARLEAAGDPATRAAADELVSAVVQMYGAGLEQIMAAWPPTATADGSPSPWPTTRRSRPC